ncbi:MAG: HlyD family efflux transporter periplasmic adaptor subunit [Burkholderiales bacterium]|nr:HlyD family efflux transporter periplasmic adaptor subunit [Burkholderiales bacterium]
MKPRTWISAAAASVLAIGLLAWALAPRPVEVEIAEATTGHFATTVDEDAKTRLRDRYVVSAPLSGVLSRVTLREGDAVAAGDVVGTLSPTLSPMLDERTLREQQARIEGAEAQVKRAAARVEGARVALLQANHDLLRSEQLAAQGFVSPTKLDADRLATLAAQKEVEGAVEERHVAEHDRAQAQAALVAVRGRDRQGSGAFQLRAPIAGRVLRVVQPNEGAVALGAPLLELGDTHALEIVAELLTTDALRADPGSPVLIERWGGEATLQGRVRLVEPGGFTKVSALGVEEQRVRVMIDITSPPERWQALGDGFRVSVRIVTLARDGALKVPVSAVFPLPQAPGQPGGAMAVFALVDGRARRMTVEVGARNGSEAWLTGGIAAGQTVIVYPPSTVADGVRVRPRSVRPS